MALVHVYTAVVVVGLLLLGPSCSSRTRAVGTPKVLGGFLVIRNGETNFFERWFFLFGVFLVRLFIVLAGAFNCSFVKALCGACRTNFTNF